MCGLLFSPWNLRFRRRSDFPNSQNWQVEVPGLRPSSLYSEPCLQTLSIEGKWGTSFLGTQPLCVATHSHRSCPRLFPARTCRIPMLFKHLSLQTGLINKNSEIQAFVHLLVISQMQAASTAISTVYLLFNLGQANYSSPLEPLLLHLYFGVRKPIPCWVFMITDCDQWF